MGKRFNLSQLKHAVEQIFRNQDIEASPNFVGGVSSGDKNVLSNTEGLYKSTFNLGDNYKVVDENYDSIVSGVVSVETDGSTDGTMHTYVNIDSGSTIHSKKYEVSWENGANSRVDMGYTVMVPAGQEFKIRNTQDPTGFNQQFSQRVWVPGK